MKKEVAGGIGTEILEWSSAIRARMESLFEAAGSMDPALHARVLFAAIDGPAQHLALDPSGYPEAEVARELTPRRLAQETAQDPPSGRHLPGGHS